MKEFRFRSVTLMVVVLVAGCSFALCRVVFNFRARELPPPLITELNEVGNNAGGNWDSSSWLSKGSPGNEDIERLSFGFAKDLTPLKDVSDHLGVIDLFIRSCDKNVDLSPLAGVQLSRVRIADPDVADLSFLDRQDCLNHLDLACPLSDSTIQLTSPVLRELALRNSKRVDLKPLKEVSSLQRLDLACPVYDLDTIGSLESLSTLRILNAEKLDLKPLKACINLEYLYVEGQFTNVSVLANCHALRTAELVDTDPSDEFGVTDEEIEEILRLRYDLSEESIIVERAASASP